MAAYVKQILRPGGARACTPGDQLRLDGGTGERSLGGTTLPWTTTRASLCFGGLAGLPRQKGSKRHGQANGKGDARLKTSFLKQTLTKGKSGGKGESGPKVIARDHLFNEICGNTMKGCPHNESSCS